MSTVESLIGQSDDEKPSSESVSVALGVAAWNGQWGVVYRLIGMVDASKPSQESVSAALDVAAREEQWDVVAALVGIQGENRPSIESVADALAKAASKQQWSVLQALFDMKGDNKPTTALRNKVLTTMVRKFREEAQAPRVGKTEWNNAATLLFLLSNSNYIFPEEANAWLLRSAKEERAINLVQELLMLYVANKLNPSFVTQITTLLKALPEKEFPEVLMALALMNYPNITDEKGKNITEIAIDTLKSLSIPERHTFFSKESSESAVCHALLLANPDFLVGKKDPRNVSGFIRHFQHEIAICRGLESSSQPGISPLFV